MKVKQKKKQQQQIWISTFKEKVDNINLFFTTTAGHAVVALSMCTVQLFSTTSFFVMIIHLGKKWMIRSGEIDILTYLAGFLFAVSLEFGIYFTAINGREKISNFFAFVSSILGFISFKGLILQETLIQAKDATGKIIETLVYTRPDLTSPDLYFTLTGVFILSFFPAFFIADVSSQMRRLYSIEESSKPVEYEETESFTNLKEYKDLINLN